MLRNRDSHLFSSILAGIFLLLLILINCLTSTSASANELVRNQEIAECKINEVMTWGDGRDSSAGASRLVFMYSHQDSPAWFSEQIVTQMITRAASAWSQCGIESQVTRWPSTQKKSFEQILIQWSEKESRGNFALANITQRTLAMSPKAFGLLRARNPKYDARQTLQMVLSHEMGHFYGLMAHSKRCVDVMSYYDDGKGNACFSRAPMSASGVVEYRHLLPTACDIERCRKINGKPPLTQGKLPTSY